MSDIIRRDPLRLIDNWDNRAAAFFASLAFALATICTNISANSLSAANDFTALAPRVRFPSLRQGQKFDLLLTLSGSIFVEGRSCVRLLVVG